MQSSKGQESCFYGFQWSEREVFTVPVEAHMEVVPMRSCLDRLLSSLRPDLSWHGGLILSLFIVPGAR